MENQGAILEMGKQRRGNAAQQTQDDDLEFLMAAAAANSKPADKPTEIREKYAETLAKLPPVPEAPYAPGTVFEYQQLNGFRADDSAVTKKMEEINEYLPDLRRGAEIHRRVREWAMNSGVIRPGAKLADICWQIEEGIRVLCDYDACVRGLAFPCGCSLNNFAAHYTPVPGDETVLGESDVMKIDYGVHINGYIIDSAFTVCFDPRFDPLIEASVEGTKAGLKASGIDVPITDVASAIEETISSYQIELDGKVYPIKPIKNLNGHQLGKYKVHVGKSIPNARLPREYESNDRMEFGDLFALETFATTGTGIVNDSGDVSHFMVTQSKIPPLKKGGSTALLSTLQTNFKTLGFCQRHIEYHNVRSYQHNLRELVHKKLVDPYPPLCDIPGSYVSQNEHTFIILPHGKEILSY